MSTYAVKSGDNLWNICKKAFGLKNNTEIANKVNEVVKANNIKNSQLIFPGQEINLDMGLTVEKTQPQKAAEERIGYNDIKTYEDLDRLAGSSVSLFTEQTKTKEQKQQAYTEYSEQLLLEYYDLNKDGKVTTEEFAQKEKEGTLTATEIQGKKIDDDAIADLETQPEMLKLYDKNGDNKISQEEYENGLNSIGLTTYNNKGLNNVISTRSTNLFAQNLDMNANGIIEKEELAFFNQNADEMDGKADGVIYNSGESAMFGAVTGMNAANKDVNRVVNKFLTGQTLSTEEEKILEESTFTIRTNMKKAAGMED